VLIYDNLKANRLGRRLPIPASTAQAIRAQQQRVRDRFPGTPPGELKLLPTGWANRDGRRPLTVSALSAAHRDWITSLPPVLLADGTEYDKDRIIPYAYRHTYVICTAWRHEGRPNPGSARSCLTRIMYSVRHVQKTRPGIASSLPCFSLTCLTSLTCKDRPLPGTLRNLVQITYAQRHADAGVPIDVLAELQDHRSLNVTRGYYRVGEDRRRAAVD